MSEDYEEFQRKAKSRIFSFYSLPTPADSLA